MTEYCELDTNACFHCSLTVFLSSGMWFLALLLAPLVIFISLLWTYQWRARQLLAVAKALPTPTPKKFLIGTLYCPSNNSLVFNIETFTKIIIETLKLAAQKRFKIYCYWIGPKPLIFVQDPDYVKIILNSSKSLDKDYSFIEFVFGEGLLSAPGSQWKTTRRLMNPLFHIKNLQQLVPLFNKNSSLLVEELAAHVNRGPFDAFKPVLNTAVRTICAIIFGNDVASEMDSKTYQKGVKCVEMGTFLLKARMSWPYWNSVFNFKYRKELEDLQLSWEDFVKLPLEACSSVLRLMLESYSRPLTVNICIFPRHAPETYLSYRSKHLLTNNILGRNRTQEARNGSQVNDKHAPQQFEKTPSNVPDAFFGTLSHEDLHFEMKTLFATGTDTIAVNLCSCLLTLGKYQHIQDKVYKEIVSVVGKKPRDVTVEDISNLPYLDRVIKETMRICMVVPVVTRVPSDDIQLSTCTIPKGERVCVSIIGLHFDPEAYTNPDVFDPDRFTPDNVAKRHSYSFLPFSGGPRNCIGKQYANLLLKIILIHLLKTYKVTSDVNIEDLRLSYVITLNSLDGYVVTLKRRSQTLQSHQLCE